MLANDSAVTSHKMGKLLLSGTRSDPGKLKKMKSVILAISGLVSVTDVLIVPSTQAGY